MSDALAHYQAGRPDLAENICRRILNQHPDNAEALHLLGGIHLQRGEFDAASTKIRQALERDPMNPVYNCNFATVLMEKGETADAIDYYRKALTATPDYLDARLNLGRALLACGKYEDAAEQFGRVLAIQPEHVAACNSLALVQVQTGRADEAVAVLETSLRVDPDCVETFANLAFVLQAAGKIEDALARYDEALRRAPDDAEIRNNHGTALAIAGRPAEAEREYLEALRLDPGLAEAHLNVGNLRRDERRLDEALSAYRRAIAGDPEIVAAYNNLGAVLSKEGRYDEADEVLNHALRLNPEYFSPYKNLGLARTRAGRFEEALAYYDKAIALSPNDSENMEILSARASVELATGRFDKGWRNYLSRPSMLGLSESFWRQPWPGNLAGKRILACRDQGLGDEIFFARFIAQLEERGAEVCCVADARLVPMFQRAGIASIVLQEKPGEDFDFKVSVGDLPYLLEMKSAGEIPPTISLDAVPERKTALARRLGAFGPPPYIGIAWRAGTADEKSLLYKEFPPDLMATALAPIDARIIVLQRNPAGDEVAAFSSALGRPVCDLSALNSDLEDMLALVGLLDDLVCVSNTNVHLRAAQDRGCRVLIPNPPEFRWMATGDESPWFPRSQLYRQGTDGDWSAAFQGLRRDLKSAFQPG